MNNQVIKCHKCRHVLLEQSCVMDNSQVLCDPMTCDSFDIKKFMYINEDKAPLWIKRKIEEERWTKGKLHCEKCNSRIGSFDYISGRKCDCGMSILPPIHLVTTQVDRPIVLKIAL